MGEAERSRQIAEEMAARWKQVNHAATTAYGHLLYATLHCMRWDGAAAAPHARALLELGVEHGMPTHGAFGRFLEPWSRWHLQNSKGVLAEMRAGIAACRQQAIGLFVPFFATTLAGAELQAGEFGTALATIDNAIAEIERDGQRWCEAEAHRSAAIFCSSAIRRIPRAVAQQKSAELRVACGALTGEALSIDKSHRRRSRRSRARPPRFLSRAGISGDRASADPARRLGLARLLHAG
jgi:predicted ATPase